MKTIYLTAARFALHAGEPRSAIKFLRRALSAANRERDTRSQSHIMRALNHARQAFKQVNQ